MIALGVATAHGCTLVGITVGEQYQQLREAATEAEKRLQEYAEEPEINWLELDKTETKILAEFHKKKQRLGTRRQRRSSVPSKRSSNSFRGPSVLQIRGIQGPTLHPFAQKDDQATHWDNTEDKSTGPKPDLDDKRGPRDSGANEQPPARRANYKQQQFTILVDDFGSDEN